MEERINKFTAFISGDLFVTFLSIGGFNLYDESWHFLVKAGITLLLGCFGGLGGLIIKDIYPVIKKKIGL